MPTILSRLMPFFALGIMVVVLIAGFILLSYLLIFGAVLGLILFIAAWLKDKFFPSKKMPPIMTVIKRGQVIDYNDFK